MCSITSVPTITSNFKALQVLNTSSSLLASLTIFVRLAFKHQDMFNHKFRYLFVVLLSLFSFGITELCEVYKYFGIAIDWYYAWLTIFGVTLFTWEGSRLAEPYFIRLTKTALTKVNFLIFFFAAGNVITTLSVVGIVYAIGHFVYHLQGWQFYNPVKLNLIYGFLINLLFHLINAVLLFFNEYSFIPPPK